MPVVNGKRYPYTQKGLDQAARAYSRLEKKKKDEPAPEKKKDDANEIRKKFPRRKHIA